MNRYDDDSRRNEGPFIPRQRGVPQQGRVYRRRRRIGPLSPTMSLLLVVAGATTFLAALVVLLWIWVARR